MADILNDPVSSAKITAGWSKSSAIGNIQIWTPDPSSNRSRDILSCHTLLELQKAQPVEPAKTAESERRTIRRVPNWSRIKPNTKEETSCPPEA
eukprot:CAMPEP_0194294680 /NCGR_PEP_ID=MMETSP0169-20130528/51383_1 /TAXON_ID=218684 /ORGANISM="Corethron pennatum, Strain L29A3" /LENGTH=93 /DNA_ID=CAMNT_0039043619 /DNA_START=10 /DNA_END=288 /DNA_ORIENTATION=+